MEEKRLVRDAKGRFVKKSQGEQGGQGRQKGQEEKGEKGEKREPKPQKPAPQVINLVKYGRYLFDVKDEFNYLAEATVECITENAVKIRFDHPKYATWFFKDDFYNKFTLVDILYNPELSAPTEKKLDDFFRFADHLIAKNIIK